MLTEYDLKRRSQDRNDFPAVQTVTTGSAYASGDVLGGSILIDNSSAARGPIGEFPLSAILQDLIVMDPDSKNLAIDLYFFNQAPATAMTNKAAFAPSVADLVNCVGRVNIATTDWVAAGANASVANVANVGRVLKPGVAQATALYCVPVIRGTPTYTTGSLYFRFKFSQGL